MGLETYRKKRDFSRTPEPAGDEGAAAGAALAFVVQKHAATRLHYDFRLELDGVLLSWAVPKGPSYKPTEKRLAIRTEDHPLEYGGFEGTIPKGEYGGGTVMLWDRGEWIPAGDPREGLAKGRLTFALWGEKLRGVWKLVRIGSEDGKENWLLIKDRDDAARKPDETDIVDEAPLSVESGLDMDGIASGDGRVWRSKERVVDVDDVRGAKRAALPAAAKLQPQLATLVDDVPAGDDWIHEIKLDGYRVLCRVEQGEIRLYTRSGKDWTARFPEVVAAARSLAATAALLDGEVVALDARGVSHFQSLQQAMGVPDAGLVYYAFDILHLEGRDLRGVRLLERKRLLAELLERSTDAAPHIRFSDHVVGSGEAFYEQACGLGLEGIISKRSDRPYRSGRGRDWLKVKCLREQEFVIVGYSDPSGSRVGLGALLVGYHEDGELRLAGKVGTGFDDATLQALARGLSKLEVDEPPVANPLRGAAARGVHWVRPRLVAQVSFTEWTQEGALRHPVYRGLREDRDPEAIVREEAEAPPAASPPARHAGGAEGEPKGGRGRRPKGRKVADLGFRITSPDKVLYPGLGLTKRELLEYYASVGGAMLPYVSGRLLTLVRCPDGQGQDCFYQKHAGRGVPDVVRRMEVQEQTKTEQYLYVDRLEGLLSLVQIGVLEVHTWGSRVDRLERPDVLVMDLDPDEKLPWEAVVQAALEVRDRLAELGLESWPRTTGGKGLHVVAPLVRRTGWEEVKAFAAALAEEMVRRSPKRYTATSSKAKRKNRVYVDYLRNARGATFIAPYSTRAREGAPVAVPVAWEEVTADLDPLALDVRTVPERLAALDADPWGGFAEARQSITNAMKKELGVR